MSETERLQLAPGETKLCDEPIPQTETLPFDPTWSAFVECVQARTGQPMPDQSNPQWRIHFAFWATGYVAALRAVLKFSQKPK